MGMLKKLTTYLIAVMLVSTLTFSTAFAEKTPTAEEMVADTVLGRPAAAVASVLGIVGYIVTLPFSLAGGNSKQVKERFVSQPTHNLFGRCLGCAPVTPADEFFQNYED